ncbi:MAG: hypothetical protein P8J89_05240 [Phycisphaerales bacterium]|nr:hypothetical protein [Phycisphaerales bacterium]
MIHLCISPIQETVLAAEIQVPEMHESIQQGIEAAESGDVVSIKGGVYFEQLDLKGKSIVVKSRSMSSPAILDGGGKSGSLVRCASGESSVTTLEGLTFRRGTGDARIYGNSASVGGGMLIRDSSPTLTNCRFEGNLVSYNGGGIYARNSNSQITGCEFHGNAAEKGAAIYATQSRLGIKRCLFQQNNARFGGGAIFCGNRTFMTIDESRFIENRASFNGGAIYDHNSTTIVENSVFLNNIGAFKGGAAYHGWRSRSRMGTGNEFRTPNDDVDGSGRTINESNPLGACFIGESCVMAVKEACEDGQGQWAGPETNCDVVSPAQQRPRRAKGDLNRDGVVDVRDMAILMSAWGSRKPSTPRTNP